MGSISSDDFKELKNELNNNLDMILKINQKYILKILKEKTSFTCYPEFLEVPSRCNHIDLINLYKLDNNIWFAWNHYILLSLTESEIRYKLYNLLEKQISNGIRSLQRKWLEYYYKPDGPFMNKYSSEIAKKNNMMN